MWRRISTKIRGDESATRFRHAPVTMLNMDYPECALGRDVVSMSERGELAVYKRYADGDKWLIKRKFVFNIDVFSPPFRDAEREGAQAHCSVKKHEDGDEGHR